MANVKISALPSIAATGLTFSDVIAQVDSGSTTTSKVTYGDFLQNTSLISDQSSGNKHNIFLAAGSSFNSPSVGAQFRGSAYNSIVAAGNGVVDNSRDSMIVGCIEAAGANYTRIENAGSAFIAASFRSRITGAEQNAIIAAQDATVNGYNAAAVGTTGSVTINTGPTIVAGSQGGTINSDRTAILGSEGCTLSSSSSAMLGSYASSTAGNLYNVVIGSFQGTVNGLSGAMENGVIVGSRDTTVNHQRATMLATSGQTSAFSGTAHADNVHVYYTESKEVEVAGSVSGAVAIDLEGTASVKTFTIGGNITSLSLNNTRMGGIYEFWVYNSGSYTVSSITLDGVSSSVYAKGGAINPTNNGYTFYRLLIVDDGLGGKQGVLNEHLNFSAL